MTKDDIGKADVYVGHRVLVGDSRPEFIGEIVRFKGKPLGYYTSESSTDDSRLERKDITHTLYECPGGYRVARQEWLYQRRRERSRWTRKEVLTSLLPAVSDDDVDQNAQTPGYGLYTEEEARQKFPNLFSAVGLPNVRELD